MKSPLFIVLFAAASAGAAEPSAYAGQQSREIKALSADEVSSYLAGRGLGLARPAELNGYPGPRHVLDSAAELQLTPDQTAALNRAFEVMRAAAIPLGEKLVARETTLDRLFVERHATPDTVSALTAEIGRLQGELRAVHLSAHLTTVEILTPAQITAYNRLRGYETGAASPPAAHVHSHTP